MSNVPKVKSPTPPQITGHAQPRSVTPRGTTQGYSSWLPEEQIQQQSFAVIPQGSYYQQQFLQQQQANQQQNYPHDIGKNFGNPQLVPGQALAQQQNMYQQQQQQRQPAPFYQPPVRPPQQRMPMGQPQGQQMYPTVMYMQPSQPGGNMNNYGAPIIVQSNPGSVPQMMLQPGQRMPVPTSPYNISQPNPAGGGYTMPQTTFPNTIMYTVQGPQRPLSAPGMSQPQSIPQKREKKVLQIVDPNTGKDILSDYNTQRSTPPGSSGSGSRGQTPNETMESSTPPQGEGPGSAIAAQFAAQVAATLRNPTGAVHPAQIVSTEVPPPVLTQAQPPPVVHTQMEEVHSQIVAEEDIVNTQNIPAVQQSVENTQSLSTNESSDVHSQNNIEPLSEIIDTRTTSEAPETVETSGEDHIPVIISNRQSESREPSQESVSANEGSNVENNTKEVSVEKVEIPSETVNTNSEEAVIHVDENKQKPTVKSEETVSEQEVLTDSSVDPLPEPTTLGESATETLVAKENKKEKSKKKFKEFDKKEMDGSDMGAFIDYEKESSQKQEIQEKPALTEEKPKTEEPRNVLIPEVTVAVPQVEISVEDQKVQEENEKNNEKTEEDGFQLKYKYKEDQWSPLNMEGKKLYDRDFLLQLQYAQKSTTKPKDLPDLPDIILENPNLGNNIRGPKDFAFSTSSQSGGFDFTPGYVRGTPSRSGNVPNRKSQQGHKRIPDRPSAQKVINLSSMQQEVKLHKAESAWKPSHKTSEDKNADELKTEDLYKKARGILNKLTPQKFQTLVKQMAELEITSEEHLEGVANLVFEKAIAEPGFSVAYASMCRYLTQIKVPSTEKSGEFVNFRAILLTRCQLEFEKDKDAEDKIEKLRAAMKEETDESKMAKMKENIDVTETNNRRRSLGNIRFIGELFKLKMLTPLIMHDCVFKLLSSKDEESLECLCKLLRTIGKELDTEKAKPRVDQYFQRMKKVVDEKKMSSRVRFMLQDVIELRQCNWVPRRDENNPKTIEQIHKEAQQEQQEKLLLLQTVNIPNQKPTRGGGRGGPRLGQSASMGGGSTPDGWNTVGGRPNMRGERQTIDPARLKLSRQNVDDNIQLGPGGGAGRFAGWQRGSSGGGSKTASQEADKAPGNRFSALSKPEEESRSRYGVSPARDGGRGRGFGRPRGVTPRSSQEQEKERALAAVRSIAGGQTTPREGPSRESSRGREPRDGSFKEPEKPAPAAVIQLTEDEMIKKTHAILDEYLHLQDIKEAITCVEELNSSPLIHVFVSECLNQVLERSNVARRHTGLFLHNLVKKSIITDKQYLQGLNSVLSYAEDMEIDIPKIWQYFGELIGPMVQGGSVPLSFLKEACQPLKESGKAGILVAEILHDASDREGHKNVGDLWRKSGLEWLDFVPEDQIEKFLKDKKLDFTVADGSQPTTPTVSMPIERIQNTLQDLVVEKPVRNEEIFDWIEANLDDITTKDKKFIRALMTAVCSSAITGRGNNAKVDPPRITQRGVILQKYLDHQAEFELQALYALQALVHKLEHPPGVLRTLFDTLYDEDIISEDAFNQWETSKDPAEQEGKGVAMKQVVQFFTWLREADDEVDS